MKKKGKSITSRLGRTRNEFSGCHGSARSFSEAARLMLKNHGSEVKQRGIVVYEQLTQRKSLSCQSPTIHSVDRNTTHAQRNIRKTKHNEQTITQHTCIYTNYHTTDTHTHTHTRARADSQSSLPADAAPLSLAATTAAGEGAVIDDARDNVDDGVDGGESMRPAAAAAAADDDDDDDDNDDDEKDPENDDGVAATAAAAIASVLLAVLAVRAGDGGTCSDDTDTDDDMVDDSESERPGRAAALALLARMAGDDEEDPAGEDCGNVTGINTGSDPG